MLPVIVICIPRDCMFECVAVRGPCMLASVRYWVVMCCRYLGSDFSIHHSGGITSKVGDVVGRVVTTTAFGSRYKLLNARPG